MKSNLSKTGAILLLVSLGVACASSESANPTDGPGVDAAEGDAAAGDAAADDADAANTRDTEPPTADDDAQADPPLDASEPADESLDASSEPTGDASMSDAGTSFDGPVHPPHDPPRDATRNDDSPYQDAASERAPIWVAPEASHADRSPPDQTWCGNLTFATTTTVEAGKTVAICAGSVVTFGASASLVVQGTLLADGTADMHVRLVGQQRDAGFWGGVTAFAGGEVVLTYTEIHDATMAFSTAASVEYTLEHVLLDNSRQLLHLMSSGTISHTTMHALADTQSIIGDPIIVDEASPHFVDSTADNGSSGSDLIQVNGTSSAPVFERMDVSHSHCALHFNTSTNATIKDSYIHDSTNGLMIVYGVDSILTGNNFERNAVALGLCLGGTSIFQGNYVDGTFADDSCSDQRNQSPMASPIAGVGPRP